MAKHGKKNYQFDFQVLGEIKALHSVRPPARASRVAKALLACFVLSLVALVFVPWQQSVYGTGRVSAFNPTERRQTIAAPVDGRVVRWHVVEGSRVKAGDRVVDFSDIDPAIIQRLQAEKEAIVNRLEAAKSRERSLAERILGLEGSRRNALEANRGRVLAAIDRIRAAEQTLAAADATLVAAKLNIDRQDKLETRGLTSVRSVEVARMEYARAVAEVDRAQAALNAAKNERAVFEADQSRIENDFKAMIEDARAAHAVAKAEIANAEVEIQRIDVRIARQDNQTVTAPRDGIIFRLLAQPGSEVLKAGEPLAVLVPETDSTTVELKISGNDMPLVKVGDKARLRFEGWPAVQFVGWPSVAVGTFGGVVVLVDPTDDGKGYFRLLIAPDKDDDPWPSNLYLRQGVLAEGWVLLRMVPLGFELWRQFNGFPPVIAEDEPAVAGAKGGKKDRAK